MAQVEIHVRGVEQSLMRDVKLAALKLGLSQREFIMDALVRAVDHEAEKPDRIEVKTAHPPRVEPMTADPFPALTHGPSGTCRLYRCGQCIALGRKY